ncbi:hypothetical protein M407DRAFT_17734 [Tulasnella calospora MUT 4182]|nr:hypothetical protein M407DRAFT_17734 [Tulasnella calospora MUT 4182]
MADFASTCLDESALRYFESLTPAIQSDWRLLRQALLTKYPPPDQVLGTRAGNPGQDYNPLTAAGAALLLRQPRKGKLRVIGQDSTDFGYIGDGNTSHNACVGGGASVDHALLVSYIPGGELYEIEIERLGRENQVLGVHWRSPSPTTAIGSLDHAVITAFDYAGVHRLGPTSQGGPGYTAIWNVRPDNTVWPHFEEDRSCTGLRIFSNRDTGNQRFCLLVAADAGAFVTKFTGWNVVKLTFEDV